MIYKAIDIKINTFYKAGYYLIKQKRVTFGHDKGKLTATCSGCINLSVFDHWCLGRMRCELSEEDKETLPLAEEKIIEIRQWSEGKFSYATNIFPDLKMVIEFKNLFFKNRNDIKIYGLSFPETDANLLLEDFEFGKNNTTFNFNNGEFELKKNLSKKIEDIDSEEETILGYDFIEMECDGSFHPFYCHNITEELTVKFNLTINKNGLFELPKNPERISAYLNSDAAQVEPLPWYIVRIKQIDS